MKETSREYAEALFALSLEEKTVREDYEALEMVGTLMDENPAYLLFLATPSIPRSERVKALLDAFEGSVPERVLSTLCLLVEKGRIPDYREVKEEFYELLLAYESRTVALVTSAVPLSEDEKNRLKISLEKNCGHSVELECSVDSSLIGGMIVEMEGKTMDGSLKSRLRRLKEAIEG
ncbi:MAG: ATP synthase F1 subunit delta [Lachnospiraceae bacterium]|mgnify:CR=1 FL=1|nr:ATP synthase F1 subunit delta [Lachnospiraceae bacterium]